MNVVEAYVLHNDIASQLPRPCEPQLGAPVTETP